MKVLIVDDSKAMRMIVMRTLRQAGYGNHEFLQACDGVDALRVMGQDPPDLVLCDWNMPEMNGLELLRNLRAAGNNVKFGFVTSESTPQMRGDATQAGALFVISKPFTADAFKDAMSGALTP